MKRREIAHLLFCNSFDVPLIVQAIITEIGLLFWRLSVNHGCRTASGQWPTMVGCWVHTCTNIRPWLAPHKDFSTGMYFSLKRYQVITDSFYATVFFLVKFIVKEVTHIRVWWSCQMAFWLISSVIFMCPTADYGRPMDPWSGEGRQVANILLLLTVTARTIKGTSKLTKIKKKCKLTTFHLVCSFLFPKIDRKERSV